MNKKEKNKARSGLGELVVAIDQHAKKKLHLHLQLSYEENLELFCLSHSITDNTKRKNKIPLLTMSKKLKRALKMQMPKFIHQQMQAHYSKIKTAIKKSSPLNIKNAQESFENLVNDMTSQM